MHDGRGQAVVPQEAHHRRDVVESRKTRVRGRDLHRQTGIGCRAEIEPVRTLTIGHRQPVGRKGVRVHEVVLPARRLAIYQEAEPVLACQIGGIGRVLHLDEGVGHGSQAERAQALDGGVDQHLFSFQW